MSHDPAPGPFLRAPVDVCARVCGCIWRNDVVIRVKLVYYVCCDDVNNNICDHNTTVNDTGSESAIPFGGCVRRDCVGCGGEIRRGVFFRVYISTPLVFFLSDGHPLTAHTRCKRPYHRDDGWPPTKERSSAVWPHGFRAVGRHGSLAFVHPRATGRGLRRLMKHIRDPRDA